MTDDEYPSVRKALFGNDHVANLYCACKWGLWHFFHVLFVVLGVPFVALFLAAAVIFRVMVITGHYLAKGARKITPDLGNQRPGPRVGAGVGSRVKETPGLRRVYNECPVTIKRDPKWFESLSDIFQEIVDALKPPTYVWVCRTCGRIRRFSKPNNPEASCRVGCNDTDWVEMTEEEAEGIEHHSIDE